MTTLDRIKTLCKEKGINITSLEKECGFSQNSIVKWAKTSPSADRIISVSKFFNVSADYLLCLTDKPRPLETGNIIKRPDFALSTELAELSKDKQFVNIAKMYKELSNEKREKIYSYIVSVVTGIDLI